MVCNEISGAFRLESKVQFFIAFYLASTLEHEPCVAFSMFERSEHYFTQSFLRGTFYSYSVDAYFLVVMGLGTVPEWAPFFAQSLELFITIKFGVQSKLLQALDHIFVHFCAILGLLLFGRVLRLRRNTH